MSGTASATDGGRLNARDESGRMPEQPLVSIGVPTYNRASSLRRAVESVLAQDYRNIELVISDNASTDETQALCLEASRRDSRIKYLRQQSNQGPIVNFHEVLRQASGEFFMWLADDDWLDSSYISECARKLIENPDYALVGGTGKYYQDGQFLFGGDAITLLQERAEDRVHAYYQQVGINGTLFGLMRREQLQGIPLYEVFGADWLLVAQVAFLSKVKTLESVAIHRSVAGGSQDIHKLAAKVGLSKFMVRNPHLKIAFTVFGDIAWGSPAYRVLSLPRRLLLASKCFVAVCRRYCVPLWHQRLYGWAKRVEAGVKHALRVAQ